jgi:hypothetical protein
LALPPPPLQEDRIAQKRIDEKGMMAERRTEWDGDIEGTRKKDMHGSLTDVVIVV